VRERERERQTKADRSKKEQVRILGNFAPFKETLSCECFTINKLKQIHLKLFKQANF
jgi:hypothetical protein